MSLATLERFQGTLIADLGKVKVRVVYSDESESKPLVVITALIMNMDEHWSNVESDLKKIKSRRLRPFCIRVMNSKVACFIRRFAKENICVLWVARLTPI